MVTREDILKIAKLAKLSVEEEKIEQLKKDMTETICFIDAINLAVEDEEEEIEFDNLNNIFNDFREDEITVSFNREEILKNSNGGANGFFVVRKAVGGENIE